MLKGEFKLKPFLKILNNFSTIIKNNPSLPVLGCVLLEVQDQSLRIAATNLEAGVSFLLRGKLEEKGSLCVPYKNFVQYFSSMEGETFRLEALKQERLKVQGLKGQALFKAQTGEEFPFQYDLIAKLKENFLGKMKAKDLSEAIVKTSFAAANDEARPELCGVFFQFSQTKLELASTNSYRLAEAVASFEGEKTTEELKVILPADMAKQLAHVLAEEEGEVSIYLSENQILFELNNFVFTSRLLEGNYPEYKEVIPKDLKTKVTLVKQKLAGALKRVGLFTNPQSPAVKIIISPAKKQIKIKAENSLLGSSDEVIEAQVEGEEHKVNYNYNYLLEGMSHLVGEKIIFQTSGQSTPGLFLSEKDKNYLYVVMPIRES